MKTPRFSILACLALGTPAAAQQLKVTGLTQAGNQITITIQDTGSSTSYRLDGSPSMAAGTWATVSATFSPVPGQAGFFRATINRPGAGKQFYRVVGSSGTTEDTDGDGLSNTFEQSGNFSDPGSYDTDGDGFNDGLEFAFGTLPRIPSSKPNAATEPEINFELTKSSVTEGTLTRTLNLTASPPFIGSVAYSVKSRSSAKSPADYTISGSTAAPVATPQEDDRRGTISFNGTSATLTIQFDDDLEVSPERLLMIRIEYPVVSPAPYRNGAQMTHVLCLSDNDAYWNGVLKDANTTRNFRLRLLQNSAGRQASFVAGTKDGLPLFDGGQTSQSNGVVPVRNAAGATQEEWPATLITSTATAFRFTSPVMPADTAGLLGTGVSLTRTLTLDSTYELTPRRMAGTFQEVLNPATPGQTWLASQSSGAFVLVRDLPQVATTPNPLRP